MKSDVMKSVLGSAVYGFVMAGTLGLFWPFIMTYDYKLNYVCSSAVNKAKNKRQRANENYLN